MSQLFKPLILSVLALSACAGERVVEPGTTASLSTTNSANVQVERSTGGSCTVDGQFGAPAAGTFATFHATGKCVLKHLGITAIVIDEYFWFDGSITNNTVYTAANGDLVESSWYSAPGQNSISADQTSATFAGDETYTGGTGRFAQVSGSSFVEGTARIGSTGAFTGHYTVNGSILY